LRILLATGNAKKGRELADLAGAHFQIQTLADVGLAHLEIIEDADTFEGNAKIKVVAVRAALAERNDATFDAVLADDSGICVDALNGAPGIRSARYASDAREGQGDEANNRLLLKNLKSVPEQERSGRFYCAVAAQTRGGHWLEASGAVEGHIARDERGAGGFGYDPLFIPQAHPQLRMAELSPEQKHAISHRGKAMRAILAELLEALAQTRRPAQS
jgi:XTP/dITP diphosphohydrolase